MRTAPLGMLAALLTVVLAEAAGAHLGDIVYPIYELPTSDLPDLHDGTLEDWDEVLPGASLDQNHFVAQVWGAGGHPTLGPPIDPSDLAFRVFLAWHSASQRLYMAVERLDDYYRPPSLDFPHNDASTQLRVDGDHSGGQYAFFDGWDTDMEESKRFGWAQAQMYQVSPESIDDRLLLVMPWHAWATFPPWADAGGFQQGELPNLAVVEFAVTAWDDLNWEGPEVSKRSVLEAGKIIGFQIVVQDDDQGNDSANYTLAISTTEGGSSSGSFTHDSFADNFVDGELIPCHRGDCGSASPGVSAVRMDSWGRIKASFR